MDAIVVVILIVIAWFRYGAPESDKDAKAVSQVSVLNPAVNTEFKHDEQAFMTIANELGFH